MSAPWRPQHRPQDVRGPSRHLSRKHQARPLQELAREAGKRAILPRRDQASDPRGGAGGIAGEQVIDARSLGLCNLFKVPPGPRNRKTGKTEKLGKLKRMMKEAREAGLLLAHAAVSGANQPILPSTRSLFCALRWVKSSNAFVIALYTKPYLQSVLR